MSAFVGEVHPLADVWPLLDGDDLDALAESIAANGLREPIVIDKAGCSMVATGSRRAG